MDGRGSLLVRPWLLGAVTPALAFALAPPVQAAQQDEQLWLQVSTHVPLAPNLRLTLEQIARFGDRQGGLFQTEVGGILGYKVAPNVEIGVGYRNVAVQSGTSALTEHRVRQHVLATFGPWFTRFRIDERFHPAGREIGFRIRPLIRYNYLLDRKGLGLFASHESFFLANGTDWGQRRGYERMRNMVGLVLPLSQRMSADVGYMNQYRFRRGAARARMDHGLSMQLTINLSAPPSPR